MGGEQVPVLADSAEEVSLNRERSFLSRAWMSSIPGVLVWSSAPSGSPGWGWGSVRAWGGTLEDGGWEGRDPGGAAGTEAGIGWG